MARRSMPSSVTRPASGIEEPQQQLEDRGLAGPGRPDQRHGLARRDAEIEIEQRRRLRPRRIAEGHALKADRALDPRRQRHRCCRVADRVGGEDQLDHPLGRAGRALQLAPDLGERRDRAGDDHRVDHELHQRARRSSCRRARRGRRSRARRRSRRRPGRSRSRSSAPAPDPPARRVVGALGQRAERRRGSPPRGYRPAPSGRRAGSRTPGRSIPRCGPGSRATAP